MKTKSEIEEMLVQLQADERLAYPPANVAINAPLALVQVALEARVSTLKWILEDSVDRKDTDDETKL